MIPNIATKTGDDGTTSLWDGTRVSKTDLRIRCVGALDLFHAALGRGWAYLSPKRPVDAMLLKQLELIQQRLFSLMGEVATSDEAKDIFRTNARNRPLTQADLDMLDEAYNILRDNLNARGCSLKMWAVYGAGGPAEAEFDYARGVCRQAELRLWELKEHGFDIRPELTTFINRLADYVFLVARHLSTETPPPPQEAQ